MPQSLLYTPVLHECICSIQQARPILYSIGRACLHKLSLKHDFPEHVFKWDCANVWSLAYINRIKRVSIAQVGRISSIQQCGKPQTVVQHSVLYSNMFQRAYCKPISRSNAVNCVSTHLFPLSNKLIENPDTVAKQRKNKVRKSKIGYLNS